MSTNDDRVQGVIAAILERKRYGFISTPIFKDRDIFFHETAVSDEGGFASLQPGMKVSFVMIDTNKGPKAIGVERTSK